MLRDNANGCPEPPNKPGAILLLKYLGQCEAVGKQVPKTAVFLVRYRSAADGGVTLAAKLYFPVGIPPKEGWPVSVWAHGYGNPAAEYSMQFTGKWWESLRGLAAGSWAHDGIVTLTPWMPGAGPSEPIGTYSPLSVQRNAQACADGFLALRQLEQAFARRPNMVRKSGITPRLDYGRQVFRTECASSFTLVHFASCWQTYPACAGLRALVADYFDPGFATSVCVLGVPALSISAEAAAGLRAHWSHVYWSLAEEQGWPLTRFFTEKAIALLSVKVRTAAGDLPRIRGLRVSPPSRSALAPLLLAAISEDLGRRPTAREICDWLYVPEMARLLSLPTVKEVLSDPLYRSSFAAIDPFYAENITPFSPGIPLLVVGKGGEQTRSTRTDGMPNLAERHHRWTLPGIKTLQSWGWDVRLFYDEHVSHTSYDMGTPRNWTLGELGRCSASPAPVDPSLATSGLPSSTATPWPVAIGTVS